jgi:hypothetical protein
MALIRCPQCATVIEDVPGVVPVCPRCGFGSPAGAAPAPGTPAPPTSRPPPTGFSGFGPPQPMGPPAGPMDQRPTSPKAITALVLGCCSASAKI